MKKFVEDGIIQSNEPIGSNVWKMVVYLPEQAKEIKPGAIAQLKVTKGTAPLLRRPISYADFDAEKGTVAFLYRIVGEGTKLMSELRVGDTINSIGPLGQSFHPTENMLLVGGGVGIAPILCVAANLKKGQKATVVLGFRNKSESFWADLFTSIENIEVIVTTNDGSFGRKGFPTDILADLIQKQKFTSVHTCGPEIMMRNVATIAQAHQLSCEASLEARMGCGTGVCYGCGMDAANGRRIKVCTHGPVFAAEEVFF